MNVLEALRSAMAWELEHDPDVVVLGEDVGTAGGIFRTTEGLQNRFGPDRVIFASDWPVCTRVASLREWVGALKQVVGERTESRRRKQFHDNAVRVYGLA